MNFVRSKTMIKGALGFLVTVALSSSAFAAQNISADPDDSIGFNVSTSAVTRLSVRGDRIRRIVVDDSAFEMSNDADTGDVFFRIASEPQGSENGYIITESGHTIGFTLAPTDRVVEPVIVSLNVAENSEDGASEEEPVLGSAFGSGFTDDVASTMTDIIRSVADQHIVGRAVPSGANGRLIKTISVNGSKAEIRIAVAGPEGRYVREQEFVANGVQAIWILKNDLGPSQRTFVVVVKEG